MKYDIFFLNIHISASSPRAISTGKVEGNAFTAYFVSCVYCTLGHTNPDFMPVCIFVIRLITCP